MIRYLLLVVVIGATGCAQFIGLGGNGQPGYGLSPTPTLVQQITSSSGGNCNRGLSTSGSYTCTLPSNPTTGNVLVYLNFSYTTGGQGSSFTQVPSSTGASWTRLANFYDSGSFSPMRELWCATLSGTPSNSITITPSASTSTGGQGTISEWSGLQCTLDGSMQTTTAAGTPGATVSTANLTTTNGKDVLFAGGLNNGGTASGPTSSFTSFSFNPSGSYAMAYQIVTSIGTYSTSWTSNSSSGNGGTTLAALKN